MGAMNGKPEEVKAFGLSRLMAGDSYRVVQKAILDSFGESVSLGVLNLWTHEDPERAQAISQQHLRAISHQRIRIAHKAGEMFEDAIDSGAIPPGQKAIAYGVAQDKLDNLVKMTEDKRHSNELLEQLRQQLLQKPVHELVHLLDEPDDRPPPAPPSPAPPPRWDHHASGRSHLDN